MYVSMCAHVHCIAHAMYTVLLFYILRGERFAERHIGVGMSAGRQLEQRTLGHPLPVPSSEPPDQSMCPPLPNLRIEGMYPEYGQVSYMMCIHSTCSKCEVNVITQSLYPKCAVKVCTESM